MPSYIVKPDRGKDFYVVWSTVVDNMTACGDQTYLQSSWTQWGRVSTDAADERFQRADETGTSARWPGFEGEQPFGYEDDDDLIVENEPDLDYAAGAWLLPRGSLAEFARRKVESLSVKDLLRFESDGE